MPKSDRKFRTSRRLSRLSLPANRRSRAWARLGLGPVRTQREREKACNGENESEREGEESRDVEMRIELPAHGEDIVFRYLDLRVWVFALNRRTRRKTRGLLRPRGLSYQIDARMERLQGGKWEGPRALESLRNARPLVGGSQRGPNPRFLPGARQVSARRPACT